MHTGVDLWVLLFRTIFALILLSVQLFLYRRTIRWLRISFSERRPLVTLTRVIFVIFNAGLIFTIYQPIPPNEIPSWMLFGVIYPYLVWHGATFFIAVVLLAISVAALPFTTLWWSVKRIWTEPATRLQESPSIRRLDSSRRAFLRRGMYGLTAASFGGTMYGMAFEKFSCDITTAEFGIRGLHPDLDGFSIGLISDIHSSLFMGREQMDRYVSSLNGMKTDLIVVAGDFVNSQVSEVYPFAESFSMLAAPHGVFGVMGNHDYYTGDPERIASVVNDTGIRLLRDGRTIVQRGAGAFLLGGIEDVGNPSAATARMQTALGTNRDNLPTILLCHRPYFLPQASAIGVDLMLSGHTHGGQIVLGRVGTSTLAPASLASKYVWGKYAEGTTNMYVSRGIGTVGLPVRLNCPPELTRIVLRSVPRGTV
jgi:hypothetical protein